MASNLGTKLTSTLQGHLSLQDSNSKAGKDALLLATCQGVPPTTANTFDHGCLMCQTDTSSGAASWYQNTGTFASPVWTLFDTSLPGDTASSLIDTNSVTALDVGTTASAVNNLRVTNSATGAVSANAVTLSAVGSDAAVSVSIVPKGATGITTIGLSTGTGDVVVGSSSATQSVKLGNGAGVSTVNVANTTVAGANVNMASAVTGAGVTDTVTIAGGNAAATGTKVVNIATGTPATSGNNHVNVGSTTSKVSIKGTLTQNQVPNVVTDTGANNAIVGALLDANGSAIPLVGGLVVNVLLAHTLQAGANTFNLNGGGAVAIKSHFNGTSDIAAVYAATGFISLVYTGSVWADMSQ